MRLRNLAIAVVAAAVLGGTGTPRTVAAQGGLSGRLEVRQLELAYRPDNDTLKMRVHLVTGLAVDQEWRDATDVDRILRFGEMYGSGRARLFVEMDGGVVRALQVSIAPQHP